MAVECFATLKSFSLGIKNIFQEWCWDGKLWRKYPSRKYDNEWYCNSPHSLTTTSDMVEHWCHCYFPGVKTWNVYSDFHITFDMDEVLVAGWPQSYLIEQLSTIANKVNRCKTVRATGEPRLYEDGPWPAYYVYPALEPLGLWLHQDNPEPLQ